MNFEKLLEIAGERFSRYAQEFVSILHGKGAAVLAQQSPKGLDANLWIFVLISVLVGSTLGAVAHLPKGADIQTAAIFLVANWFAFSAYAFFVCKVLLRGPATFVASCHALLRLLAVSYVVCNFVAIFGAPFPPLSVGGKDQYIIPAALYLVAQILILLVYLPVNLRALNDFRGWRTATLILLVPTPLFVINTLVLFGAWVLSDFSFAGIVAK